MKKAYQKPYIKVRNINTESILAAVSPGVGGNTGIDHADPDKPTPPSASAKGSSLFDADSHSGSSSLWGD